MSVNRKTFFVFAPFLMLVALIIVNAVPALELQGDEIGIIINSTYDWADQPDVAIDSKGNVHIVYFNGPDKDKQEIWYTMLDNDGKTLIDDTQITYSGYNNIKNKHPTVVVDSYDMVHIVWHDTLGAYPDGDLSYSKLDPSLDDQDGTAADPTDPAVPFDPDDPDSPVKAKILVKDRIRITYNNAKFNHPRMAVDSNGDIHIVWEAVYGDAYYMKMEIDDNDEILIKTRIIRSLENMYGRPHIAVDSNNNVHIAWNDDENTSYYAIYYMMLDGIDGSTLIDATLITPGGGRNAKRQSIVIDSEDKVHIIWHDHRGHAAEIYYTKLDPYLDDRNGDAADPAINGAANPKAITLIDDTALTPDDDNTSKNPQSAISYGRNIHIAYYEETDAGTDVFFMIIDTDGNVVEPVKPVMALALTTNGKVTYTTTVGDNQPNLDVDANGKAHIVWCDERNRRFDYEIYYTTYQCPSCSPNTPAEQDVTVDLGSGGTVTFDNVTAPGNTTVTTSGTPPGDSFFINFIPVFYGINTTATFDGNVSIEITYDDSDILPTLEPFLRLFKFKGSPPVATDITDYSSSPNPDTDSNKIIGVTDGFSIFAVGVPVKQVAIVALSERLPTGDDKTDKKIEKAIKHIEKSLAPELWEGVSTLTKKGKKVFDEDKKAVKDLQKLIKDKKVADEVKDVCKEVIDKLVTADVLLAETALNEAKAYEGTDKKVDKEIEKSEKEMEKAQKELDHTKKDGTPDPKYDKAIEHYKKAWEHAQHAMKHAGSAGLVGIAITSPLDGDAIFRPDVTVECTIANASGNETGVTVNGIVAGRYGDRFVANHVPLQEGGNTIIAAATNTDGNTATASIMINAVTSGNYISLSSDTETGIPPLTSTLRIDGSFGFTEPSLTYTGPGVVEILAGSGENEYNVMMPVEGIYNFTATVMDAQNNTYTDTIAVTVVSESELDTVLRAKWEGMKDALTQNDADWAANYFSDSTKNSYKEIFLSLTPEKRLQLAQELDDIQIIRMTNNLAEYDIRTIRNGKEYSFYLMFVKDENGLWKIRSF